MREAGKNDLQQKVSFRSFTALDLRSLGLQADWKVFAA